MLLHSDSWNWRSRGGVCGVRTHWAILLLLTPWEHHPSLMCLILLRCPWLDFPGAVPPAPALVLLLFLCCSSAWCGQHSSSAGGSVPQALSLGSKFLCIESSAQHHTHWMSRTANQPGKLFSLSLWHFLELTHLQGLNHESALKCLTWEYSVLNTLATARRWVSVTWQ